MGLILGAARVLALINSALLAVGRQIAIVFMALMVVVILLQVFMRYVMNDALPWPDEAARFMMLWLTGLVAPTAFRRGGFVAIDMLVLALPRIVAGILSLALLALCLLVLVVAVQIGWKEVTGFSGSFKTAALQTLFVIEFADGFPWLSIDWGWQKMPRSQMMASLLVGVTLMSSVCAELILRQIAQMAGREKDLPIIPESSSVGAE